MNSSTFQILPHTADVRLMVTAPTQKELFCIAMTGMGQIQQKGFCENVSGYSVQETIHIKAPDMTILLIDFLSEILTFSHIDKAIFCKVEFKLLNEHEVMATIKGNVVTHTDEDIKAVTYHEASVEINENNELSTMIIFDI